MLTRLGHFTVRRRRLVLSLTVLFMLVGAVIGTRAFGVLEGGGFEDPSSESARAGDALDRDFGTGEYDLVLVATAAAGDVDAPARGRGRRGPRGEGGGGPGSAGGGVVLEPRPTADVAQRQRRSGHGARAHRRQRRGRRGHRRRSP